jgi:uncharacterized protein YjbI with pentapeptide repeats
MTAPEKPLYHTTRSGSTFYNGCARSDCKGERISGFDWCIVHLSPEESEQYASRLRARQGELVIASVNVDMNFVRGWIDRISTPADGFAVIPVPLRMQDTVLVGGLEFRKMTFEWGINLTKLRAYDVRMFEVVIGKDLRLEEAVLENELALADEFEVSELLMPGMQAKTFGLSRNAVVGGRLDARGASFERTNISETEIRGSADFSGATLCNSDGSANIVTEFQASANFTGCKFLGETRFANSPSGPSAKFLKEVVFDKATFGSESIGLLDMTHCVFEGPASFDNAEIFGSVSFNDAKFIQSANLNRLEIRHAPSLRQFMPGVAIPNHAFEMRRTQFQSSFSLSARVDGSAVVDEMTLAGVADKFSISATRVLRLVRLTLESFNSLTLSSDKIASIDQVHMNGGGELKIGGATFQLTNFTCIKPVLIQAQEDEEAQTAKPRLTTLKGTNCDGLTLSGFDYSETSFLGAAKLDSLVITGEFTLRSTGGARARRAVISEEAEARASTEHWNRLAAPRKSSTIRPPELRQLAGVYRALRKAREDQKDEPGSADFYYGEMEMRRLSSAPRSMERIILTAYWLISGYGLRAWRSLALLALVVVGSATALSFFTLRSGTNPPPPSFGGALLFSAQSGLQMAGSADRYTTVGQVFELVLRIVVPILIALAALAVRGRVKR